MSTKKQRSGYQLIAMLISTNINSYLITFVLLRWYSLMCVCVCSVMSNFFATPWTVVHQAPLSMGFPRQKYWSGLPFPPPGELPNPGIEPMSPASPALQVSSFTTKPASFLLQMKMSLFHKISQNQMSIISMLISCLLVIQELKILARKSLKHYRGEMGFLLSHI